MKDKIAQKEMEVKYCPTKQMWSDVMTKPQQGQLFQEMQASDMNCPIIYNETIASIASSQGCIEKVTKNKNNICNQENRYPMRYLSLNA